MESCFCIYQRMSDTHCKYTEYRTQACPLGIHHQKIQICKRQQFIITSVFGGMKKTFATTEIQKSQLKDDFGKSFENLEFIAFQQSQISSYLRKLLLPLRLSKMSEWRS